MISVIIPLYNKEKSIARTLNSVMNQTFFDWECIVVDDGSTDKSAEVVNDIIKKANNGHKIHLINKSNGGVSSARNLGVKEAKGDYVAFLDGDDLWESTYLEEVHKLIVDFPNASIYGVGIGKLINEKRIEDCNFIEKKFRGIVSDLWNNNTTMMAWTSSSTISPRGLALINLANENLTHGEDLDVWLRLMLSGPAVFYNKTLAYYVQDAENRAMNNVPAIEHHIVSVINQYKEARESNADFRKAFDTQMIYFLYEYMFTIYKKETQRLAKQLDYTQLKWSLKFRMFHPYLCRLLLAIKKIVK